MSEPVRLILSREPIVLGHTPRGETVVCAPWGDRSGLHPDEIIGAIAELARLMDPNAVGVLAMAPELGRRYPQLTTGGTVDAEFMIVLGAEAPCQACRGQGTFVLFTSSQVCSTCQGRGVTPDHAGLEMLPGFHLF